MLEVVWVLKTYLISFKKIYGICETNNLTKKQVNEYKMTKRQIYKTFTNLSKKELNTKSNKKCQKLSEMMS